MKISRLVFLLGGRKNRKEKNVESWMSNQRKESQSTDPQPRIGTKLTSWFRGRLVETSKRICTKYPLDKLCITPSHAVVFCLQDIVTKPVRKKEVD